MTGIVDLAALDAEIQRAAGIIDQADALVVAAGAGMGVDSGLPDFRGKDGFWKAYPALRKAGIDFTSIASPAAFRSDPVQAWGFYGHRLGLYRHTQPHEGFRILRRWGEQMLMGTGVFTSNVDGQFQKAGFNPDLIHECHGSIHHLQCLRPCTQQIWSADVFPPKVDEHRCALVGDLPLCPHCGDLARPNLLMFGDGSYIADRSLAQERQLEAWLHKAARPVVVEIGAGTRIPSVRHFSHWVVLRFGSRLIRINPLECKVPSSLEVGLPMGTLEALTRIDQHLSQGSTG